MYAPQPSRSPVRRRATPPSLDRKRSPQRIRQVRQNQTRQDVVVEVGAKLAVNVTLAVVSLIYLGRLLSYNLAQEQKLENLQAEVAAVDERVSLLREEFAVQFDTHQTQQLIRQQRHRISPSQMQVIWTTPSTSAANSASAESDRPEPEATAVSSRRR